MAEKTIEEIINSDIKEIDITISYSNHDLTDDIRSYIEDDMRNTNVKQLNINAKEKRNEHIILRENRLLKGALLLSQSNGEAKAKIVDSNGRTKTIKTSEFPRVENVTSLMSRFCVKVYEKIINIYRNNHD